jgi:hypothetical protein
MDSKIRQLPLVSKAWNRACQSPASWHSIRTRGWLKVVNVTRFGWSKLINEETRNDVTMRRLMPRLSCLEVLHYEGTALCDNVLSLVIQACGHRLRELDMNCTNNQLMIVATGAPNLQSIHSHCWLYMSISGLAAALPFLRQLRSMRMHSASLTLGLHDIGTCCPFLETYDGSVDEPLLMSLSSCMHLTNLDMHTIDDMTNALTVLLPSVGHNLRFVKLPPCDGSVVFPLVARHCRKLEKLIVKFVCDVTDALAEEVLSRCGPTLACVKMQKTFFDKEPLTDAFLVSVAAHCPNLADLDLNYNSHITDAGVIALAASCPNLRRLGLRQTDISVAAVLTLAEQPALIHITVDDRKATRIQQRAHLRRVELGLRPLVIDDALFNFN